MTVGLSVSCVIPVYNGERYLAEAVDSALSQSQPPLEIIVVDDGSTDTTEQVARRFGDPVVYLHQDNAGAPAARNRGVAAARGDLVAFLDSDDIWLPEKLARQAAAFAANPELDVSTTDYENFWVAELAEEERSLGAGGLQRVMAGYVNQTGMVRRRLFESVGLFDPALTHRDGMDWYARAVDSGAVAEHLAVVLTRRRLHHDNVSRKRADDAGELLRVAKARVDRRRGAAPKP